MTLLHQSFSTSAAPTTTLSWRKADDDVLVATDAGEYAGFVSTVGDGFDAHGSLGEDLGHHSTAGQAQQHVETARVTGATHTPVRAHRRFSLTRPHRTRRRGTHGR